MSTYAADLYIWFRHCIYSFFFFQAEDGIRDLVRSRGLGDVYKRQVRALGAGPRQRIGAQHCRYAGISYPGPLLSATGACLLYTSDAADDLLCVDLGGRRIIEKKKTNKTEIVREDHYKTEQLMLGREQHKPAAPINV